MTAVVGFGLMRLASRTGIRVILNGQGADETAAGYFSYFGNYWRELMTKGPASLAGDTGLCRHTRATVPEAALGNGGGGGAAATEWTRKDKMGFPTPQSCTRPCASCWPAAPCESGASTTPQTILWDLEAHRRGEKDVSERVFRVAQFELWVRMLKEQGSDHDTATSSVRAVRTA